MKPTAMLPTLLLCVSCILPDYDIQIVERIGNPGAVRIVERVPLPEEMRELCEADDAAFCHQVARSRPSGLIAPEEGAFCVCPDGMRDERAIAPFKIYAEDPDLDGDEPEDTLYGVLLLDPSPADTQPQDNAAYGKFLPCGPGRPISVDAREQADPLVSSETRDPLVHWEFRMHGSGRDPRIDLCNDEGRRRLSPGLHNVQFMVTDRPFFRPVLLDEDGEPLLDEHGEPILGETQCGVPDLAAGATYATTYFVFECIDGTGAEADERCACTEEAA